jgi:hypothetical protein
VPIAIASFGEDDPEGLLSGAKLIRKYLDVAFGPAKSLTVSLCHLFAVSPNASFASSIIRPPRHDTVDMGMCHVASGGRWLAAGSRNPDHPSSSLIRLSQSGIRSRVEKMKRRSGSRSTLQKS